MSTDFLEHAKIIGAIYVDGSTMPVYQGVGSGIIFTTNSNSDWFELEIEGFEPTKKTYDEKLIQSIELSNSMLGVIMGNNNQALIQVSDNTYELRKELNGGYNSPPIKTYKIELDYALDIEEFVYQEEKSII